MTICGGSASELREVRSPKSYMFRFFQLINESVKSKGIQMTGPLDPIHDLIGVVYTVKWNMFIFSLKLLLIFFWRFTTLSWEIISCVFLQSQSENKYILVSMFLFCVRFRKSDRCCAGEMLKCWLWIHVGWNICGSLFTTAKDLKWVWPTPAVGGRWTRSRMLRTTAPTKPTRSNSCATKSLLNPYGEEIFQRRGTWGKFILYNLIPGRRTGIMLADHWPVSTYSSFHQSSMASDALELV